VFIVEKWKINENIGSIPSITKNNNSFQVNKTYIYKPFKGSSNASKLKVLEDVNDETIANQVIEFIRDNQ
jgi:hypothetical protein